MMRKDRNMKKRKAIILYCSITGNTEMIAKVFGEVLEQYHFEVALEKVTPKRDWKKHPVYFDDCDFLILGAPIVAGLPYKELSQVIGWTGKNVEFYKGERPVPTVPGKMRAGMAFTTFGGSVAGPRECIPTLSIEKEYLQLYGFTPVAEFACPGKQVRHGPVDILNAKLHIAIEDAQALLQRFKENPDSVEFTSMPENRLKLIRSVSAQLDVDEDGNPLMAGEQTMFNNDPLGNGMKGSKYIHYDLQSRPNQRDLRMARDFMTEVVEDIFLTQDGEIRHPMGAMYSLVY